MPFEDNIVKTPDCLERRGAQKIEAAMTRRCSTAKSPSHLVGGDKTQAAHAALQAAEAAGIKLSQGDIAKALGVSHGTVSEAARDLKAATATPIFSYTKAQDNQVEARLRVLDKAREDAFRDHVRKAAQKLYDENFPTLEREQNEAFQEKMFYQKMINNHEHIFTMAEYNDLLLCTHEANPSDETRKRAFMALNARKFQLTGKR